MPTVLQDRLRELPSGQETGVGGRDIGKLAKNLTDGGSKNNPPTDCERYEDNSNIRFGASCGNRYTRENRRIVFRHPPFGVPCLSDP